jgi:hypothetical protein
MKQLVAIALVGVFLSGCAAHTRLASVGFACDTYNVALDAVAGLNERGRLRPSDVEIVDSVVRRVGPVCESPERMAEADALGVVEGGVSILQDIEGKRQ